jgi:hypothetical protein
LIKRSWEDIELKEVLKKFNNRPTRNITKSDWRVVGQITDVFSAAFLLEDFL